MNINWSEWISYWYLRLNGFFPLQNFVVHRADRGERSSEVDLLAIRPPNVYEEIGGQDDDWDETLLSVADRGRFIGLICEVKRGDDYRPETVFRPREIRYALDRLGIISRERADEVAGILTEQPRVDASESLQVRKLLIGDTLKQAAPPCDFVPLKHARDFFDGRVRKYRAEKREAWTLFHSSSWEEVLYMIEKEEAA
jgi:hypothetical protein